jgi:hypothetical protein
MFMFDPGFFTIPDPGSRGQNSTGFRIRNTVKKVEIDAKYGKKIPP